MSASLKLTVSRDLSGIGDKAHAQLGDLVMRIAGDVRDHAHDNITQGAKTGHVYLVPIRENARWVRYEGGAIPDGWKLHTASAPGESPAGETGTLEQIQARRTGELSAEVDVPAEYGAYLEFGTTKIAPRPFLAPALDAVRPAFEAGAAAILRKAAE